MSFSNVACEDEDARYLLGRLSRDRIEEVLVVRSRLSDVLDRVTYCVRYRRITKA